MSLASAPNPPMLTAGPTSGRGLRAWINPAYLPLLATFAVLIALLVVGRVQYPNFTSPKPLADLFNDNAFLAVAAIGATVVILTGGIDLSTGAVVAFSTIFVAKLVAPTMSQHLADVAAGRVIESSDFVPGPGWHPILAAGFALLIGSAFGCFMGMLIALYELPSFMVTLAGMFFARAMGFVVYRQSISINHPFYQTIESLRIQLVSGGHGHAAAYLQPMTVVMLAMFVLAILILQYTSLGRNVYAIGGDENSARLLGVPIVRTKIITYTIAGFCSALAGVMATVYKQSGDPASQIGLELDAIAAVVIGGTLLTGGRGFVIGTLLGVLMLGLIQNFINFNGNLRAEWARIFIGTLMLVFILLQTSFNSVGRWLSGSGGKSAPAH